MCARTERQGDHHELQTYFKAIKTIKTINNVIKQPYIMGEDSSKLTKQFTLHFLHSEVI